MIFAHGTTVHCVPGAPAGIIADRIEWNGTVRFECAGHDGAPGQAGQDQGGWCTTNGGDFRAAVLPFGGNGADGHPGEPGTPVLLTAEIHLFRPGAEVLINNAGGAGGEGGRAGMGRSAALAPFPDDCDHGVNFRRVVRAPSGLAGRRGPAGAPGFFVILGNALLGRPRVQSAGPIVLAGTQLRDTATRRWGARLRALPAARRLDTARARVAEALRAYPEPSAIGNQRYAFHPRPGRRLEFSTNPSIRATQEMIVDHASRTWRRDVVLSRVQDTDSRAHLSRAAVDFTAPASFDQQLAEAARLAAGSGNKILVLVEHVQGEYQTNYYFRGSASASAPECCRAA